MSTIAEETSNAPASVGRLVLLIAVPAIALAVMAALALQQDSPRRQLAPQTAAPVTDSVTSAPQSARYDADYTLYIMGSADDAERLIDYGARGQGLDWHAFVNTPEEEAELIRARDEADLFRHAAGLPTIRVVDLRLASASPTAGQAAMP